MRKTLADNAFETEILKSEAKKDQDLQYAIEKLLDIVEECMPKYSSSDTIAEILDIHKKYFD